MEDEMVLVANQVTSMQDLACGVIAGELTRPQEPVVGQIISCLYD